MDKAASSSINLADIRNAYRRGQLHRSDLHEDPIEQFNRWLKEACDAGVVEPTAMSLATTGAVERPLVRTVLLKGLEARGVVFFTNMQSRKARQLAENPNAALLFPWLMLERQVIVTGPVEQLSTAEVLKYFLTRPRDSQLAAWASRPPKSTCRPGCWWLPLARTPGILELPRWNLRSWLIHSFCGRPTTRNRAGKAA